MQLGSRDWLDVARRTWDARASDWDRQSEVNAVAADRPADLRRTAEALRLRPGSALLDAGCGSGQFAMAYAAMGCRHYKMKIHHPDPQANRARVAAVKKALGPGVRMMVDANQKYDVETNVRQAALLEEFDLVWYEEPVLADDLQACAAVARRIRIPVATGENNYTRYEFRDLLERDE